MCGVELGRGRAGTFFNLEKSLSQLNTKIVQ